jgi:hypothetical protein
MTVSNQCWFVRVTPLAKDAFEYQEAAYDGRTLYHLFRTDLRDIPAAQNLPAGSYSVATATIYQNQRVVYDVFGHHIAPLWLMFASSQYFLSLTNNLAEPALLLGLFEAQDFWKNPFRIPARWKLQAEPPHLPVEVVYWDDGEIKADPPFLPRKRPPPLDKGFTNVVFRVTQTARFAGYNVPGEAEVATYKPSPGGVPPIRGFLQYRIVVHDWQPTIAATQFKPKLPGRTAISDRRLYSMVDSLTYTATNDWPTLERLTNLPAYK